MAGRTNVGGVDIGIHGDAAPFNRAMRGTERQAERSNREIRSEFKKTGAAADFTSNKIRGVGVSMLALGAAAGLGLTAGIGVLKDFGQAMSTLEAVTGATAVEMQLLEAEARRLGSTTRFSGTEAAEGLIFLARAGFTAAEALAAVEGTLTLAQAGGLDLGKAADIASNVLGGFNLQVDQTGRVVDVLAKAANSANVTVTSLGEALKFAAPTSAALGLSLEETVAVIGKLGDSGLSGGLAGRGFQSFATSFVQNASKIRAIIGDFDLAEEGLNKLIKRLVEAGISTDQVIDIFKAENLDVFTILANASQDAAKGTAALTDELNAAKGTARDASRIMDDNLNGAILATVSALQELILQLRELGGNDVLISGFTGLATLFRAAADNADILAVAMVALAVRGMVGLISAVPGTLSSLRALTTSLTATTAATTRLGAVMAFALNPATLAIAGAAAAWVVYSRSVVSSEEAQSRFNQTMGKLRKVQEDLASDTDKLKTLNEDLRIAIENQAPAAEETARREIAALTKRIAKNKELNVVYSAQLGSDLGASRRSVANRGRDLTGSLRNFSQFRSRRVGQDDIDFIPQNASAEQMDKAISQVTAIIDRRNQLGVELGNRLENLSKEIAEYRISQEILSGLEQEFSRFQSGEVEDPEFPFGPDGQYATPADKPKRKEAADAAAAQAAAEAAAKAKEELYERLRIYTATQQQQALDLARAEGNEELVRILEQESAMRQRIADYMDAGIGKEEARAQASEDIRRIAEAEAIQRERAAKAAENEASFYKLMAQLDREADARIEGEREISEDKARQRQELADSFANAIQQAVSSGDVKGAIRDVFAEQAAKGLRAAVEELTDLLFQLFKDTMGGSGGSSSSGLLGSIISGVGSIFGGIGASDTPGIAGPLPETSGQVSKKFTGKNASAERKGDLVFQIAGDVSPQTVELMNDKFTEHRAMLPSAVRGIVVEENKRGGFG